MDAILIADTARELAESLSAEQRAHALDNAHNPTAIIEVTADQLAGLLIALGMDR